MIPHPERELFLESRSEARDRYRLINCLGHKHFGKESTSGHLHLLHSKLICENVHSRNLRIIAAIGFPRFTRDKKGL